MFNKIDEKQVGENKFICVTEIYENERFKKQFLLFKFMNYFISA